MFWLENRWNLTCEHNIQHDSTGPDVSLLAVVLIMKQNFRSDVIRGATNGLGSRIDKFILAVAKIADFYIGSGFCSIQEGILQFYVPAGASQALNFTSEARCTESHTVAGMCQVT